tara:strand:+ start:772 stop:1143 length:372 start_codon:yes stop_codon:yes gene_type:complete
MATKFKNYTARAVGTSTYYLVDQNTTFSNGFQTGDGLSASDGSKAVIMIGCMVSNILTTSVDVTVTVKNSSNETHLVKNVTVAAGDAVEVVQGKIVLNYGDDVGVSATSASAVDVVASMLIDA